MKTFSTTLLLIIFSISLTLGSAKLMAQPMNDFIVNAIDVGYGPIPYTQQAVDFPNATNTNDTTPGGTGCSLSQPAVWYKFTATKVGTVTAGIINPDGAVIVFFTGPATGVTTGSQLTHVDQNNNPCDYGPLASIQTTIGTTYYVYMRNLVVSDIGINTSTVFQAPENDHITNAINLNGIEDYFKSDIHFLLASTTDDGGQQGDCDTQAFPGIWYKFTAGSDGQVVAGISTAANESAIIFYSAENENAQTGADVTWVNQPSNGCATNNLVSIQAIAGTTYYIFVVSISAYADFSINLSQVQLSNESFNVSSLNYYPNPVKDVLQLESGTVLTQIRIFNIAGQEVLSQKISDTQATISLATLTPGIYMAEVSDQTATNTVKIIKH